MIYTFFVDRCGDLPVAVSCRAMKVSTSGFYEWRHHQAHPRPRIREDQELVVRIRAIHQMSRQTYGSPRVHAELRLGENIRCSRKRVERLMRQEQIAGVHKRRRNSTTRRDLAAQSSDDLVNRGFDADGPNRLWVSDITEHPTAEGKVYLAAVIDAFSRRVIGWSISEHIRSELVVDALQMAIWRRYPNDHPTVVHSDHGAQYTSWAFGRRLRAAGLLGSMGSIGDAYDNAAAESFFSIIQRELFDRQRWNTRTELATAIFEYIEGWYNPRRRHSYCNQRSPIDYELAHPAAPAA